MLLEKKEEVYADSENEETKNDSFIKPKGPPQEDFPWPHFASLAMHNLIAHWDLQPVAKVIQEEQVSKVPAKVILCFFYTCKIILSINVHQLNVHLFTYRGSVVYI